MEKLFEDHFKKKTNIRDRDHDPDSKGKKTMPGLTCRDLKSIYRLPASKFKTTTLIKKLSYVWRMERELVDIEQVIPSFVSIDPKDNFYYILFECLHHISPLVKLVFAYSSLFNHTFRCSEKLILKKNPKGQQLVRYRQDVAYFTVFSPRETIAIEIHLSDGDRLQLSEGHIHICNPADKQHSPLHINVNVSSIHDIRFLAMPGDIFFLWFVDSKILYSFSGSSLGRFKEFFYSDITARMGYIQKVEVVNVDEHFELHVTQNNKTFRYI